MFWSRERSTIQSQFGRVKEIVDRDTRWGQSCSQLFPALRSHPVEDNHGMGLAMMMLEKSLEKGRNANYTQFATVRQLRSAISNIYTASAEVRVEAGVLKSRKGEVQHLHDDPMQSVFMERFMAGLQSRMPLDSQRDAPLLGHVVSAMLDVMAKEVTNPNTKEKRRRLLTMTGAYMAVTYSYSLRGNEGFWVDGDSLVANIHLGRESVLDTPHVVVGLCGRFKAEGGYRMHVFSLANVTKSGVQNRWWLERVTKILEKEKRKKGPAFCDERGFMLSSQAVEGVMHVILRTMQKTKKFADDIPLKLDVEKSFRCFRSFRRGAENTALRNGVDKVTINFVHRWSAVEGRRGAVTGFDMLSHYADGVTQRPKMLEFTARV